MKIVLQKVKSANVKIGRKVVGKINPGVVVFIGISTNDNMTNIIKAANKIINLRIFPNNLGKMDYSLENIKGEALIVSQFTLYGECNKGNRPSFNLSADTKHAENIYNEFVNYMKQKIKNVQTGKFGAMMEVEVNNDGPTTFLLEY